MSCCGSKRESLKQSLASSSNTTIAQEPAPMWNDVWFELTGAAPLVIKGSVTGTRYYFSDTGKRLLVDYRDVSGMRAEPLVQKVNS
jgi:hypothetical protein